MSDPGDFDAPYKRRGWHDTERFTVHLDEVSKSILCDDPDEQPFDRWVGRCIVANGCFDVLHPGHLSLLAHLDTLAYKEGLRPLVAINSDESVRGLKGPRRPVVPLESRSALLNSLKWPFTVVVFDEASPQRLMDLLKPPMVLKGDEYPAESVVRWKDSKVVSVPMMSRWSTTGIIGDTR